MSQKQRLRQRIRQQTDEYLARGGRVHKVDPGTSGQEEGGARRHHQHHFSPRQPNERTPLPEVVAAIEARKKARTTRAKPKARRQPRKRLIYDDFGEPLRWEWVDD